MNKIINETLDQDIFRFIKKRESSARTYADSVGCVLVRGMGSRVYDSMGNDYLDCLTCAGTLSLGHNHPEIHSKIIEFLESGAILQGLDISTPVKGLFIKELFAVLPPTFATKAKIQFCGPTGSDATEAAVKLFKTATGRHTIFSFQGGYHGMSAGALAMTGNLTAKAAVPSLMSDVHFLPYPYAFRCPFGTDGSKTSKLSLAYIERMLTDPESGVTKPAMIILEAVQGEGGVISPPMDWLQGLRALTRRQDVPLVIDEIQTGFGRTGDMFAFEYSDIEPDAILISKAIGGGLPLSAVIYHERYDAWKPGAHAGTFRGNQLAMAAGIAFLEIIRRDDVLSNVRMRGQELAAGLAQIAQRHAVIGEVRGRGLMWGLELVDPNSELDCFARAPADGAFACRLKAECLSHGLLTETGGRHGAVLRLLPPLNLTASETGELLQKLSDSFDRSRDFSM